MHSPKLERSFVRDPGTESVTYLDGVLPVLLCAHLFLSYSNFSKESGLRLPVGTL